MDPASGSLSRLLFGREKSERLPEPLLGFVRFLWLVSKEFSRNRCTEKAASLAFETLLSFVPAFVLSLFLIRSIGGLENVGRDLPRYLLHQLNVDEINLTIPMAPSQEVRTPVLHVKLSEKIQEIVETADQALRSSSVSFLSLLGLIMTAIFLALTLEHALNDVWASHGRRGILLRVAISWTALTLGPLVVSGSVFFLRGLAPALGAVDALASALGPMVLLYLLYRYVPAADVSSPAALLGSASAATAWAAAKLGFGYYVAYAVGLDKIYGTLGLLPIFLIWLCVAWMIVLSGAEVAYTYQNLLRLTAIERRRLLAPFVLPGSMALDLVVRAAKAFRSPRGAITRAELAETTGLPDHLWTRLLDVLLEKRILAENGNDRRIIPGKPLEAIRVDEVFSAVEDVLVAQPEDSPHAQLCLRLAAARRRELGTGTVADLMATP